MDNKTKIYELGNKDIPKLLFQYSAPAIIATSAASLYNIIDRVFIGHGVGALAISGLALTFPLMNIAAAFGAMVGVGASAMVSIRLGQNNKQEAILILGNAISLNIIFGISISILGLIFLEPILCTLGASQDTLPYAKQFMEIILIGNMFTHLYLGLNNIMRASGYPFKAMITTLITVAINLTLAPIFIFLLKWGIRGAALATVTAQMMGTLYVIIHFLGKENVLSITLSSMQLKFKTTRDILSLGMSNFLMLLCSSVVLSFINLSLKKYGDDHTIGAFGIISGIMGLAVMIVIGFNQGMQPIVGYNFGARQISRVLQAFKLTVLAATTITSISFLVAELFPWSIAKAFTNDDTLINMTVSGLRLSFLMFPIVGFQIVTSNFFQSTGKSKISIFLSLIRQVLLLIPALIILPRFLGLNGVWLSLPASDFSSALLTYSLLQWQLKKLKAGEINM